MANSGWFKDSYRHYLAAKGISTNRYTVRKYNSVIDPDDVFWTSVRERTNRLNALREEQRQLGIHPDQLVEKDQEIMEAASPITITKKRSPERQMDFITALRKAQQVKQEFRDVSDIQNIPLTDLATLIMTGKNTRSNINAAVNASIVRERQERKISASPGAAILPSVEPVAPENIADQDVKAKVEEILRKRGLTKKQIRRLESAAREQEESPYVAPEVEEKPVSMRSVVGKRQAGILNELKRTSRKKEYNREISALPDIPVQGKKWKEAKPKLTYQPAAEPAEDEE